jgi:hypothetical protein
MASFLLCHHHRPANTQLASPQPITPTNTLRPLPLPSPQINFKPPKQLNQPAASSAPQNNQSPPPTTSFNSESSSAHHHWSLKALPVSLPEPSSLLPCHRAQSALCLFIPLPQKPWVSLHHLKIQEPTPVSPCTHHRRRRRNQPPLPSPLHNDEAAAAAQFKIACASLSKRR